MKMSDGSSPGAVRSSVPSPNLELAHPPEWMNQSSTTASGGGHDAKSRHPPSRVKAVTRLSMTPVSLPFRVWSNHRTSQESISIVDGPSEPSRLTGVQGMCAQGPTTSFWLSRVRSS